MMNYSENSMSVCLFGSAARSSTDPLSDRDVLVTARILTMTRPRVQEMESKGWSVALFSHARLERMAAAGSLFVQHLKMEGRIIQDTEHWLEDCLSNFSPKNSYEEDINGSFDLIRPLERIMDKKSKLPFSVRPWIRFHEELRDQPISFSADLSF